ncbi:sensor domain-containing diguanylate cyclase [Leucothrix mucor]|uniref:sensor domain-containing diguanylate cyclase n=1 Tax=Leucothrix mucor TaxID=45248 RepID=UPI0003B63454|nr:diguanylate cyclase [Leucothrix mucor]
MCRSRRRTHAYSFLFIALLSLFTCFQHAVAAQKSAAMHWIEDKSGSLTFEEVRDKDLSTQWNLALKPSPNFGFTESIYWLSLPFENDSDTSASMLLEMGFPLHDKIDVYLLDGKEVVKSFHTGDQIPFSQRPLDHRNFMFPQTVAPEQKLRAIVRVQSTDTMYFPVRVWESNDFLTMDQHHILVLGVFFGFLLIMMVYNLFLYFSTRDKNYLYYVWCTATIIHLQLTQKGLGFQFLWSDSILFNHLSVPMASFVTMVSGAFFILNFLELDEQHKKTIWVFKGLITLSLIGLIWTCSIFYTQTYLISYTSLLVISAVFGIIITLVVMGLLLKLSIKGSTTAQILSVAWLFLLMGTVLFALGRLGAPLPMMLTENAMLIGSSFEAVMISFALARHIKTERDARMAAQELALSNERETHKVQKSLLTLQERTTQQLEQEVKERTLKLETAMKKLTFANEKLDSLARLDSLTGLSNRRNFDQAFDIAWRETLQQRQPMSMMMADIDHFKKINDTYGHLFGDQCLMKVANILKKCVTNPSDLAARFGGEEFIIMLPDTDSKVATSIAELIRKNIEKLRMNYEGEQIKFTISIGVATIVPTRVINSSDLNERADQALYLAKEEGRNRVVATDGESALTPS